MQPYGYGADLTHESRFHAGARAILATTSPDISMRQYGYETTGRPVEVTVIAVDARTRA
jgi:hypothetical protein